jgi:hypothetical protein
MALQIDPQTESEATFSLREPSEQGEQRHWIGKTLETPRGIARCEWTETPPTINCASLDTSVCGRGFVTFYHLSWAEIQELGGAPAIARIATSTYGFEYDWSTSRHIDAPPRRCTGE